MCNTRSKVCLQSMRTYILSVNTLTWNLTSEHHDNCVSCLGLILPIRWVTPPPNFCLECFQLALHLQSLRILFVFNVNMASCLSSLYWFGFCPLQHSLIAMSSRWIFWTKWMWSEPNLSMLLPQILSIQIICILLKPVDCLLCILVSRRQIGRAHVWTPVTTW